ncbi:MAG: hypothetical protein WCF25_03365 [Acidimicrobiales bacterium]
MGALVLGMHRSGTSALAGALEAMGLSVGPAFDVMPADDANPEGYYELLSIVKADDDLLAHFGGRWDSPPDFARDWHDDEVAKDFVVTMREHLGGLFSDDHYLLKDPRMSLLLPVWRQVTEDRGCAIVIVRDPVEVATSLHRRNDLQMLTGLALWAAYNRAMLRDLRGARVHVCTYGDLVEKPVEVLTDIAASLRAWGEVPDDLDLTRALDSIRPDLRRSSIIDAEESPIEIRELMKLASDQRGRHDEFDMATELEPGWWEVALLEERRTLLQWALAAIGDLEANCASLLTENKILWEKSDNATREVDRLHARINRVQRMVPGPLYRLVTKVTPRS